MKNDYTVLEVISLRTHDLITVEEAREALGFFPMKNATKTQIEEYNNRKYGTIRFPDTNREDIQKFFTEIENYYGVKDNRKMYVINETPDGKSDTDVLPRVKGTNE